MPPPLYEHGRHSTNMVQIRTPSYTQTKKELNKKMDSISKSIKVVYNNRNDVRSCVRHNGLSLIPDVNWGGTVEIKNQDIEEIKFTVPWLQQYLKQKPIRALSFLLGDPRGQFRGIMSDECCLGDLHANILMAYLIAWNAATKKTTRDDVFIWIYRHWQPLFRAIKNARTKEEKEKDFSQQVWSQEEWVTRENVYALPVIAKKAAVDFFQKIHSCYLTKVVERFGEPMAAFYFVGSDFEYESDTDSKEPPAKRVKRDGSKPL